MAAKPRHLENNNRPYLPSFSCQIRATREVKFLQKKKNIAQKHVKKFAARIASYEVNFSCRGNNTTSKEPGFIAKIPILLKLKIFNNDAIIAKYSKQ